MLRSEEKYSGINSDGKIISIIAGVVTLVLFGLALRGKYVSFGLFVLSMIALSIAIYHAIIYCSRKEIIIHPNELELRYKACGRHKNILLSSIASWSEAHRTNFNAQSWNELKLHYPGGVISITSDSYLNYYALKAQLTKGLPRNAKEDRRATGRGTLLTGFTLILCSLLCLLILNRGQNNRLPTTGELIVLSGVASNLPQIERHKNYKSITIDLPNYPNPGFIVNDYGVGFAKQADFSRTYLYEDTLWVTIDKKDYYQAISGEQPAGIFSRTFGFSRINVFGLRTNKHVYFKPEQVINAMAAQAPINIFLIIILGFLLLFMGLHKLMKWSSIIKQPVFG